MYRLLVNVDFLSDVIKIIVIFTKWNQKIINRIYNIKMSLSLWIITIFREVCSFSLSHLRIFFENTVQLWEFAGSNLRAGDSTSCQVDESRYVYLRDIFAYSRRQLQNGRWMIHSVGLLSLSLSLPLLSITRKIHCNQGYANALKICIMSWTRSWNHSLIIYQRVDRKHT